MEDGPHQMISEKYFFYLETPCRVHFELVDSKTHNIVLDLVLSK